MSTHDPPTNDHVIPPEGTRQPVTAEPASKMSGEDRSSNELFEVAPRPGSTGWYFSVYQRIGRAKIAHRRTDGFDLYGVYGVRPTPAGWELFIQWEGQERDGVVTGRTLLASSCDLDPYIWSPAEHFAAVTLAVVAPETSEGDDPGRTT